MKSPKLALCLAFVLALTAASPALACTCKRVFAVANDDAASTPMNTTVNIAVLANDSDTCAWDSVWVSTAPSHGTATVVGDNISYTPDTGFTGTDTFEYANNAGCLQCFNNSCVEPDISSPGTVTVTVY